MLRRVIYLILFLAAIVSMQTTARAQWSGSSLGGACSFLITHDSSLYVSTTVWDNGGIFRSTNGGKDWIVVDTTLGQVRAVAIRDSLWIGGTGLWNGNGGHAVIRSTDNGNHWIKDTAILTHKFVTSVLFFSNRVFMGTTGDGIFESLDNGMNWKRMNGVPDSVVCSLASVGSRLLAGTIKGVIVSEDSGAHWRWVLSGTQRVMSLLFDDSVMFAGEDQNLYKSNDGGMTWDTVASLPFVYPSRHYAVRCFARFGKTLFAGDDNCDVISSTDGGNNWKLITESLQYGYVTGLAIGNGNLILSAIHQGVWQRPLSEMITFVGERNSETPSLISLSGNYPNPFSTSTSIEYTIPQTEFVTLRIFNTLGEEVNSLVGSKQPAGNHTETFRAGELQSGIYSYRLTVGSQTRSEKMIVVR